MIALLFALQAAACTPVELCRALEAAAATQDAARRAGAAYRATVETEAATLNRSEGRIEGAAILEKVGSTVRWSSDGGTLHQHLIGWRSSTNAVPLTRLAIARIGWLAGGLNGSRIVVVNRSGPVKTGVESLESPGEVSMIVHPLGPDRTTFYTYSGGTEESRSIDGTSRRVRRVVVAPAGTASGKAVLFEGEMDLDPVTGALVRLFGRIRPGTMLVELINQQLPDGSWVPLVQRFELESISSRTWGFGSAVRIESRFHDVEAAPGTAAGTDPAIGLSSAPRDSLRAYRSFSTRFGSMTDRVSDQRFARFRSSRLPSSGPPIVSIQGYLPGEFVRINKVEGIYTGLSILARLRDAAPGFAIHVTGGYAWHEKTARGRAGVAWAGGPWRLEAGGARELDVTNKFTDQFDNAVLGALVGRDNWDYLERRDVRAGAARGLDRDGSIVRIDAAAVEDRAVVRHLSKSLAGWRLRDNRGITEGNYFRIRALLDWNPEVSPGFARTGLGVRAEVEQAGGDLDYTRVQARIVGRAGANRVTLLTRLHAGQVFGDRPPPQQLFEIGGPAGLPGYEYKEFAGDRAMLLRTRLTYALPMLDTRRRTKTGGTWPALAPALSLGFSAGIADVRTAGGAAAVNALGVRRDDATGELITDPLTGRPLPAAVAGPGLHSSIDIRLGLFGDALSIGWARALEQGRKTKLVFAFGRQF